MSTYIILVFSAKSVAYGWNGVLMGVGIHWREKCHRMN